MVGYILRRLAQSLVLIAVVLIINFFILRLTPGNPYEATQYNILENSGGRGISTYQQTQLDQLKARLGIYFDPAPQAFVRWASGVLRLDFGNSAITGQPFTTELMQAGLSSLWLLLFATLVGLGLGVSLGLYAAYHVNSWQDRAIKIFALVIISLPGWYMITAFDWFNTQLWLLTGQHFSLAPVAQTAEQYQQLDPNAVRFWMILKPIFFLGAILLTLFWGQTRSQALAVLNQDYVRTAHARGLRRSRVMLWYVLRNSLTPILSIFSGLLPFVFASQILIEKYGQWYGLSQVFLSAASARDYTILMGVFTLIVFVCVLCSFLADVTAALLDPKIREKYQGLRLAKLDPADGQPTRRKLMRWLPVGIGVSVVVLISLLIINPFATKTTDLITSAAVFDPINLPTDGKLILTDVKTGERKPFLPPSVTGGHQPQPAENSQKASKRTVFTTKESSLDVIKKYQTQLEGQGWQASKTFGNQANLNRANYVYEKPGQYFWLSAGAYNQVFSNTNPVEDTIANNVGADDTIVVIIQGFSSTS